MHFEQIDYTSKDADTKFANSLKNTGFAILRNHTIDDKLVKDVFGEWQDFFNSNYKHNYLYNNTTQDGFFPCNISETAKGSKIKDIKEFFHYYPHGQFPKELTNKTKDLYKSMNLIAKNLLSWVEAHLPHDIQKNLSQPLSNMIDDSNQTLLRILHYPPLSGQEDNGAVRAAAHGDINLLTILVAASSSGLQVQDIGGNWIDVPVDPGMIAVNIGDMLEEATNSYYKSTLHRVINPIGDGNVSRYSIPLFLHPRPDVRLSDKYTADEYLTERLIELGIKSY